MFVFLECRPILFDRDVLTHKYLTPETHPQLMMQRTHLPPTQRILPGIVAGDAAPDAPVQDPETPTAPCVYVCAPYGFQTATKAHVNG